MSILNETRPWTKPREEEKNLHGIRTIAPLQVDTTTARGRVDWNPYDTQASCAGETPRLLTYLPTCKLILKKRKEATQMEGGTGYLYALEAAVPSACGVILVV